jgi:6-pyruvoyltetrahydropterin/6-carboxytetrahydropterin synthase
MYYLNVSSSFSAAHKLVGYEGACRRLHGHNWKVRIQVGCVQLDTVGMALDFKVLKTLLNELLDEFDHQYLNEILAFSNINPTSEHIARHVFDHIQARLPEGAIMVEVEIAESDNSSVIYRKDE